MLLQRGYCILLLLHQAGRLRRIQRWGLRLGLGIERLLLRLRLFELLLDVLRGELGVRLCLSVDLLEGHLLLHQLSGHP